MKHKALRAAVATGLGCAVALSLTATSVAASRGVAHSGVGKVTVPAAAKLVNEYAAVPTFSTTGLKPFVPRGVKGKSVGVIPVSSSVPFNVYVDRYLSQALSKFGVKVDYFSNTGQKSELVSGMDTSISEHVNAIDLIGMDPQTVAPQIAQAKADHIPTIDEHFRDVSDAHWAGYKNVAAVIGAPYDIAGRLEAAWAVEQTRGKGTFLVVQSPTLLSSTDTADGITKEMKAVCPSCHLVNVDVPFNTWSTRVQTAVSSALTANPNTTYVLPVFDGMVQYVVSAIIAAHKSSSVHISTYNADPAPLLDLKKKDVVTMDLGESYAWLGYALADDTLRILSGLKPVTGTADVARVRVFTSKNVGATGTPPTINEGYGNAFVAGYDKVWSGK